MSRRQAPLKVEIPNPGSTPMRLGRVGLIALAGFGVGIAWPRLAGIRLVPELPQAAASSSPDLSGAPDEPATAAKTASAAPAPPPPPTPTPEPVAPGFQPPVVGEAQVTSCRDAGGGKIGSCDAVDFDRVARARLSSLEGCDDARKVSGTLSLGFELDFTTERVTRVTSGKATALDESALSTLLACYKESFSKVSLAGIPHEHQRYTVFYRVEFKAAVDEPARAPAAGSAAPPVNITPASGVATVSWDTALVRVAPDRDSKVVARVLSGTRVGVTGRSGDWYRVKYDARGREGWVFRTSIGM
ncbi:MAG TPA: SH3 domain-containing protein [Polyangiaceae bacterium]